MSETQAAVNAVIADNPDKTQQARQQPALVGWFVGQIMKRLDGKGDVLAIRAALLKRGIG